MKAYLEFQGFSRMMDVPSPMSEILIPVFEVAELCIHRDLNKNVDLPVLSFYRDGELSGGNEVILKYRWDGKLPRSNDE